MKSTGRRPTTLAALASSSPRRRPLTGTRRSEPLEQEIQVALFRWAALSQCRHPELRLLFAVPNGMHSNPRHVRRQKAAGLRPGVPDVWLPVARQEQHGLVLELKTRNGRVSASQVEWIGALQLEGYRVRVCRGFDEARREIEEYLS